MIFQNIGQTKCYSYNKAINNNNYSSNKLIVFVNHVLDSSRIIVLTQKPITLILFLNKKASLQRYLRQKPSFGSKAVLHYVPVIAKTLLLCAPRSPVVCLYRDIFTLFMSIHKGSNNFPLMMTYIVKTYPCIARFPDHKLPDTFSLCGY